MIFRISSAAFLAAARAFLTLIDIRCSSHVYCYELSRASCNHTPPCGPGCPSYDPSNQYPPYLFISLCPLYSPPRRIAVVHGVRPLGTRGRASAASPLPPPRASGGACVARGGGASAG